MEGSIYLYELVVPLVLAPLLWVGYRRTRALRSILEDERLASLGRFFLLYGLATVLRFTIAVAMVLTDRIPAGSPAAIDPIAYAGDGAFAFHFLVVHGLVIAAFGIVAGQYLRRRDGTAMASVGLFGALFLPAVEAALALVPAVHTFYNHRGRHTRRSFHITLGFALLAIGHLGLVPLTALDEPDAVFHLVSLSQMLALSGALTLVLALPRGKR